MHDYQKDPELIKTLQEIINTPGYDPDSVREAQRQMIQINQGLPRFPGVLWNCSPRNTEKNIKML